MIIILSYSIISFLYILNLYYLGLTEVFKIAMNFSLMEPGYCWIMGDSGVTLNLSGEI